MVAAEDHGHGARREHVGNRPRDLVEGLLEVRGNREDVAGIAEAHLLAQVDAELVVVRRIERRDPPHALRSEPRARPVCRAAVEGHADDGGVVFANLSDVLDIRRLEEGVDAGEMRQLAAGEGRDRAVADAVRAGKPVLEAPLELLLPTGVADLRLGLRRLPAARLHLVEVGMMEAAFVALGATVKRSLPWRN